jgi:tRNA A-37 threonylcarbamoyl transferase component Bud32
MDRDQVIKLLREEYRGQPDLERRFLEEARINGRLQHPGIVPVYDRGKLPDQGPFFTMKQVEGRKLADLLAARKDPTSELPRYLSIFEQICQTVAYAHSRGVIHRDLNPRNVMVGAFGEVQVMDWGLAKVLDRNREKEAVAPALAAEQETNGHLKEDTTELFRTRKGQMMGTLAYLPPEQARGEVERVDRRSDVFGLGAILCEILTGHPPFTGKDTGEVRARAKACDLTETLARLDGCGADGELVALAKRCLAAEPQDRPSDAGVVAKEVATYQAGVQERLRAAEDERVAAQARAEEAKATAAAEHRSRQRTRALAAALVLGTAISIYFALDARQWAKSANDNATDARNKERVANVAREQTEEVLARSLLRPLGHGTGPVNDIELDALWELAESPSDRVRLLFVESAVEIPAKARQLRHRAELALHAAVGLDRKRRQQVEGILLGRLRDDSASRALREEVALAAAQATPSSELSGAAAYILTEALAKETNPNSRQALTQELRAVAARLGPEEAGAAARVLTDVLAKETIPRAKQGLAEGLGALAARLGPEEAARHAATAARLLSEALAQETDPSARSYLAQGLSAVDSWLGPEEAARHAAAAARPLSEALAQETDPIARHFLARGLSAVVARLGPEEAAAAARLLSEALAKATDPNATNPNARSDLAYGLGAVATPLSPKGAAAAARIMTEALAKATDPNARLLLAEGLSAVAIRLSPEEAAAVARFLTEALVLLR